MSIEQAKKNVLKRKHEECLYLYESRWVAIHYINSNHFTLRLKISSHNKQSDFLMNMANRDVKWSQSIVEWQKKTGLEIYVSDGWGDREYDYLDIMFSCDKNSVDSATVCEIQKKVADIFPKLLDELYDDYESSPSYRRWRKGVEKILNVDKFPVNDVHPHTWDIDGEHLWQSRHFVIDLYDESLKKKSKTSERLKTTKKLPEWFSEFVMQQLKKYKATSGRDIEDCLSLRILREGFEEVENTVYNEVNLDITQTPNNVLVRNSPTPFSPTKPWFLVRITDWSVDNKQGFENLNPDSMTDNQLNDYYSEFKNSEIVSSQQTCWPADVWGECKFQRRELKPEDVALDKEIQQENVASLACYVAEVLDHEQNDEIPKGEVSLKVLRMDIPKFYAFSGKGLRKEEHEKHISNIIWPRVCEKREEWKKNGITPPRMVLLRQDESFSYVRDVNSAKDLFK